MYLVGVDTGGTKSRCIIVDETFDLLGFGSSGPGNFRVAGTDGARANVESAIYEAMDEASLDEDERLIGGFGMGTLDTDDDYRVIDGFLSEIDVIDERYIENDVVTAYYSITAGGPGVVVIGGTGAMAFGRNEAGDRARSSGWGWLFGDEGSGFYAAQQGLQAASKAYDGRGPETALLQAAYDHFGLEDFEEVFPKVIDSIDHAKDIASFAEPVAKAANDGDPVARMVVEDAVDELISAGDAVITTLGLDPAPTVGCLGGFATAPVVSPLFESKIADRYPEATVVEPLDHPIVGTIAYLCDERDEPIDRSALVELDAAIGDLA